MSAVLPWLEPPGAAASPALAAAAGLAAELEALGLEVELKWPNDLLVDGRKLAGLLPRLRWRGGGVQQARLGIGLNGRNRVPPGGISVAEALGRRSAASEPAALAARVLAALEWATAHSGEPETVRAAAERRLRRPPGGLEWQGVRWHVLGLEADGGLVLALGDRRTTLRRRF